MATTSCVVGTCSIKMDNVQSKKGWEEVERSCALMDSANEQIDGIDLTDLLEDYTEDELQDALNALSVGEENEAEAPPSMDGKVAPRIPGNDQQTPRDASFVVPWVCLHPAASGSPSAYAAAPSAAPRPGSFNERSAPSTAVSSPPPPNAVMRGSVDPFLMKYRLDTYQGSHSFGGLPSAAAGGVPLGGATSSNSYSASGLGWNSGNMVTSPTPSDKSGGSPGGSPNSSKSRFGLVSPSLLSRDGSTHGTAAATSATAQWSRQLSVDAGNQERGDAPGARGEAMPAGGQEGSGVRNWNTQEVAVEGSPVRNTAVKVRVRAGANPAAVEAYLRMKAQRGSMVTSKVMQN